MTLSTIMGSSYACLGGIWDTGMLERDRVRNLYLPSAITPPGLCAVETPLGSLSRPTPRRSTPITTTAHPLGFRATLSRAGSVSYSLGPQGVSQAGSVGGQLRCFGDSGARTRIK